MSDKIVNQTQLKSIISLDDGEMKEILFSIFQSTDDSVEKFKEYYDSNCYEKISTLAHSLRSEALMFGLTGLSSVLIKLEYQIKELSKEQFKKALIELSILKEKSNQECESCIGFF